MAGSSSEEVPACICEDRVFDAASSAFSMVSNQRVFRSPGLAIGETRDDGMQVLEGKDRFCPETDVW